MAVINTAEYWAGYLDAVTGYVIEASPHPHYLQGYGDGLEALP